MRFFLIIGANYSEKLDGAKTLEFFSDFCGCYGYIEDDIIFAKEVFNLVLSHRFSPVEFCRKDNIYICDENYDFSVISASRIEDFLFKAGVFVGRANKFVGGI